MRLSRYLRKLRSWIERHHAKTFQHIRDELLEMNAAKQSAVAFDKNKIRQAKDVLLTFENEKMLHGEFADKEGLLTVFNAKEFQILDDSETIPHGTAFFHILRNSKIKKQIFLLLAALRGEVELYFVEQGFVSQLNGSTPCSWIIDDMAFYYDANVPSRIEQFLNSDACKLTPEKLERAQNIISLLRKEKITKYNNQPIYTPKCLQEPGKKILVADQSMRDASIQRGMASEKTFSDMLAAALDENPDAKVFIKIHPDSIYKGRGSYYAHIRENNRIHKIVEPVNPWCVLEAVDKVYVATSQIGLEALMCEKETHCFGMPIYAGWGLTRDRLKCERRVVHLDLVELVYGVYVHFTFYTVKDAGNTCEIKYIISLMGNNMEQGNKKLMSQ
jgi:capsule polysaccharide export protein KpsC/LpsZ